MQRFTYVDPDKCVFPKITEREKSIKLGIALKYQIRKDTRVFTPGEKVCYKASPWETIYAAEYNGNTEGEEGYRYKIRIFDRDGERDINAVWFDVGKIQTIDPSIKCLFPKVTDQNRNRPDTRGFAPREKVCYKMPMSDLIYPAVYIQPTPERDRHEIFVNEISGRRLRTAMWYDVGKISVARGIAELGNAFGLPREIDEIIYSQVTGIEREQATPEQKQKNLSELSKEIDQNLERQQMAKEDNRATTSNSNVNMGGRKTRKVFKFPRKYSKKYCKKTSCKKMGFTQRSSCRPYKNCFKKAL